MSTNKSPLMSSTNYKPVRDEPLMGPVESAGSVPSESKGHLAKSSKKLIAVIALFIISLVSFVSQTELTSYLYNSLGFNQPYFLLFITHGSWWWIWPIQVISIATFKHFKKSKKHNLNPWNLLRFKSNIKESIINQHKNIFKSSRVVVHEYSTHEYDYPTNIKEFFTSPSIIYITKCVYVLAVILNIAGCTWYVAMQLAPASDITAIYNCSAFTALVFAIPILKEKFTYIKLSSVLLAVVGVFFVAYSGQSKKEGQDDFPDRFYGDLIISVGAILYGLYEVLYKKLVCPAAEHVSAKRQVAFSNFCASLLGIASISIVWVFIVIAHIIGVSKFVFITDLYTWFIIVCSVVSNLIFSLSFLSLMSLTSPVLSSVSSLITILFVGLFEWILFSVSISFQQLVGDLFVVIGFGVLSYSYWNEITEEDVEDDETEQDSIL